MSGRDGMNDLPSDATLATALPALPESAPMPDLWPGLAREIAARRRRRAWHYALPAALAAGIALALVLPRIASHDTTPPAATTAATNAAPAGAKAPQQPAATPASELADLHQRSQILERWIAAVAARAPQDSRDLMAAVEVEDLIGLVDVQLGGARSESDALPLWRQRVSLLESLATIRGNAFAVAENRDGQALPASLDLIN